MNDIQTDIAVIGAGPAGLAAALETAKNGCRATLIERNRHLGGILNQCIHDGFGIIRFGQQLTGPEYADIFVREVLRNKNITVLSNAMVTDVTREHRVTCVSSNGITRFSAKAVVFATGCRERTQGQLGISGMRPAGIYTAGLAQELINIRNIAIGKRAVILGSGDIGLIMARRLTLCGMEVLGVYEKMSQCGGLPRNRYQCLDDYGSPLHLNTTAVNIHGGKRLEGVTVVQVDTNGNTVDGSEKYIECDTMLLSVGLIPENEVAGKLGLELAPETNGVKTDANCAASLLGFYACGNSRFISDLVDKVSDEGETAGRNAALFAAHGG
jgi:sarcosine oxidase subunit alpha